MHECSSDPKDIAERNDTPISVKKDIMGDKTVRVRADLHHIIKEQQKVGNYHATQKYFVQVI